MKDNARRAFTLIELLVVIALISTLAAMLFPVFGTVREKARQSVCVSNLRQIGMAVAMYAQDYDDRYAWGASLPDKHSNTWGAGGDDAAPLAGMPVLQDILKPYTKGPEVWRCPSDVGYDALEDPFVGNGVDTVVKFAAHPSSYVQYGTSYLYRTALPLLGLSYPASAYTAGVEHGPAEVAVLWDAVGAWHGGTETEEHRWNALMGDGHAVFQNNDKHADGILLPLEPVSE